MAQARKPGLGFIVGEAVGGGAGGEFFASPGQAGGVVVTPDGALIGKRSAPLRGRGLSVAFSRRDETKKGLLGDRFLFQVPPTDSFSFSAAFGHTDYDTVSSGQYSRPGGRQLKQIQFSTLFVDYDPQWAAWHYGVENGLPPVDPLGWTGELLELVESGSPFDLTVGQPNVNGAYDIRSLAVTMRNLEVEERAGEPDARYVNVQLVEWRPISLARRRRGLPATVTLHEKGDRATWDAGAGEETLKNPSLSRLAKKFYGSPARYRYIAQHPKNRYLRGYVGKDLRTYVQKHGRGKKGDRTIKIVVPDLPATDDVGAVVGPTSAEV